MGTPITNSPRITIPSPPPNIDDEVEPNQHGINAKPKPNSVNGGMMTSTDNRRASPPRRLSANHDDNSSPTSSSGSSSSTPTPTATNHPSGLLQATAAPHHRSLSPHHVRKSPDPGLRRNPSAGSGTTPPARYSGLISVPEEGDTSMDFSTSSLQPPTSASTITARNYGTTSFAGSRDEGRVPHGQSPPRYLGGLDLSGEDPYDSEDEEDLEDWLIDEELANQGLYRGSYKRILLQYTLTPLTTLIAFTLLSLVPVYLRAHSRPYPSLPEPIPPGSSPELPRPDSPWSGGYTYTSYLPYPLPELVGGMAIWSLGFLTRQGLGFLGGLLSSEEDDDEEDEAEITRPQGEFELGDSQVPAARFAGRTRSSGKARRGFLAFLALWRNTIIGCFTILVQSVLSIFLQLIAILLLSVTLPPSPPLPPSDPDTLLPSTSPRLSPYTPAFARIWYIALGWAAIEAILGIAQGYANLALYKDVVVSVRRVVSPSFVGGDGNRPFETSAGTPVISLTYTGGPGALTTTTGGAAEVHGRSRSATNASMDSLDSQPHATDERQPLLTKTFQGVAFPTQTESPVDTTARALPMINTTGGSMGNGKTKKQYTSGSSKAIEMEVEHDLEELVALKKREELEEMYGMPFIYIPSFISCLHRLNALLFAVGSFLLVGAGYLRSIPPSIPSPPPPISFLVNLFSSTFLDISGSHVAGTATTKAAPKVILFFLLPTLSTLLLSILHSPLSPRVLPWIGIHTYVFVSLMVSLGVFFAALGGWGAVV